MAETSDVELIKQIRSRYHNIWEWHMGRSFHCFVSPEEHASALAKWYAEDVEFLLNKLREESEKSLVRQKEEMQPEVEAN